MNFSLATLRQFSLWQSVETQWGRLRAWYAGLSEYFGTYIIAGVISAMLYVLVIGSLLNAYIVTFGGPTRFGLLLAYALSTAVAAIYGAKNILFDEDWPMPYEMSDEREFPRWYVILSIYFIVTILFSLVTIIVCIARLLP